MNKKETIQNIEDFIKFNSTDITKLYKAQPLIATAFESVLNALSKEYGSGEVYGLKPETVIEENEKTKEITQELAKEADWKVQRDIFMNDRIIGNLTAELKKMAIDNQIKQGNIANETVSLISGVAAGGFTWRDTSEGRDFWLKISDGSWEIYYDNPTKWENKVKTQTKPETPKPTIDVYNPKSLVGYTLVFTSSNKEYLVTSFLRNNPKNKRYEVENTENKQRIKYDIAMSLITKILSGQKASGLYIKELQGKETKTPEKQIPQGYSLNVETIPNKLRFGIKFIANQGERSSPSQSAGELYKGYNSAKDVSDELLKTYFRGNDGLWYHLAKRTNGWVWRKASPQPGSTKSDYSTMSDIQLRELWKETAEAQSALEKTDPEYEELTEQLETIKKQLEQNRIKTK